MFGLLAARFIYQSDHSLKERQYVTVLKNQQTILERQINNLSIYPNSSIIAGILLGSDHSIPKYLREDLQKTSTIHMMVASGQNLSMLFGFLLILAPFFGRKKLVVVVIPVILYYAILTGFEIPIVRALLMSFVAIIATLLGRQKAGAISIIIVAWLMLMFEPKWLHSVSFQLSFLATIGVVVIAPILQSRFKLPQLIGADLAISLAAQLMVLPVIVTTFKTISIVGLFANILTLWTIPIIMVFSTLALVLGLVSQLLGQLIMLVPTILTSYIIYIVSYFAQLPFSVVYIENTNLMIWVGYYLFLFGLFWRWSIARADSQKIVK